MSIKHNPKRALVLILSALVLLAFGIAGMFYTSQNKKVDPRIVHARELYSKYDSLASENEFNKVFELLYNVERIYTQIPHYKNSYEMGVIENNRAATFLGMAIYFDSKSISLDGIQTLSKDSLLKLSKNHATKSISIYENWLKEYGTLNEPEIEQKISHSFLEGLNNYSPEEKRGFLKKRIEEIKLAQLETKRRLSVAYTNYGIILRHQEDYKTAILNYEKALELWDQNLAAKNSLNALLGRPMEKQNVLQKIFPPEKNKE